MLDIKDINNLITKTLEKKSKVSTLACEIENDVLLSKKHIVKVITNEKLEENKLSTAISFSREVSKTIQNIYHHIGIYIYNVAYLKKFVQLRQTQNEKIQKLEQLRLIDNKIDIDVGLAKTRPIGVDTHEDYLELKKIMEYKN